MDGVLPKEVYAQLVPEEEPELLSNIVRIFKDIPENSTIDIFGEIYEYFLDRTKKYNPELGAFNTLPKEEGDKTGLPVAVKDLFCEVGVPTTASSKMLGNFVSPYESTVTERMKQ